MNNNYILPQEIKDLLEEIVDWAYENDYECGERGGDIIKRINNILEEENNKEYDIQSGQPG